MARLFPMELLVARHLASPGDLIRPFLPSLYESSRLAAHTNFASNGCCLAAFHGPNPASSFTPIDHLTSRYLASLGDLV